MVKNKRKQENLCQKEVAGLCGVGVRLLSDLENGKETIETGKLLQVLHGLGITVTLEP